MKKIVILFLLLNINGIVYSQVTLKENPCREMYKIYEEECKLSGLSFSRAVWGTYNYYNKYFITEKFDKYCEEAFNGKKIIPFEKFKKEVCKDVVKKRPSGKIPKKLRFNQRNPITEINTQYGKITLLVVPNKEVEFTNDAFFKFKNKKINICESCYVSGFEELYYKIENINVYQVNYSIGNASEGGVLIFDTPTGLYYTYNARKIDLYEKSGDEINFYYEEKAGEYYVFTYKNGKMYEKNPEKLENPMKMLN
ncbi:MAG: hypothetical protein N2505_04740 [Endomicrobia bacterium]|nr:hypothetical protein [Endomicrobiia bacterium]